MIYLSIDAPSFHALKLRSNICLAYVKEYDLKFNTSKYQLVKYVICHNIPFYFDNVVEYKCDIFWVLYLVVV